MPDFLNIRHDVSFAIGLMDVKFYGFEMLVEWLEIWQREPARK